ncbi:MAG TPA: hypothetical protein VNT53_00920 [Pseudolysinimonas sp.]|nr:hypothetical protein [Pseudolysinimonas sp.]
MKPVEPHLTLTCIDEAQCKVYFEPWGTEHVLERGTVMYVESAALLSGDVEVSYVTGGITLVFTSDAPVTITDGTGRQLEL